MDRQFFIESFAGILIGLALLYSGITAAEGIAAFHDNCLVCHSTETPTLDNADPEACHQCHGEAPDVGLVSVNSKEVNPHQVHFDVYKCSSCHPAHKPGIVGCAKCHTVSGADMPNK